MENTFGLINMLGLVGGNGNDDKVTMFLSLVLMLEFILLNLLFKVVKDGSAGYILSKFPTNTMFTVGVKIRHAWTTVPT